MLDLPDLIASEVIHQEDKIIFVVKTKEECVKCPVCGTPTDKVHDSRWQNVLDSPIRGKHVFLRLDKKRYRCSTCFNRGFSQTYDSIDLYARKTIRFDEYLANQAAGRDYSRVAKENNLSYTVMENAVKNNLIQSLRK